MITLKYSLCGINLDVQCQHPSQNAGIDSIWQGLFSLGNRTADSQPAITLRFTHPNEGPPAPASGAMVFESDMLQVLKTSMGFHLKFGASMLDLDVYGGNGHGVLDKGFWNFPLQNQREFFLISLLMLMRRFGFYGLHANAVVNHESGFVIVGASGAGKTTLTITLMKQGWDYLSDDALLLQRCGDNVDALAFRRGFSFTPETTERFPELGDSEAIYGALRNGKKAVNVDCVFPGQHVQRCFPKTVIFPEISGKPHSELIPLTSADTLARLFEQSPGIMIDKPMVSKQLKALTLLVDQANGYRMRVGTDVYDEPEAVSELLLETQQG